MKRVVLACMVMVSALTLVSCQKGIEPLSPEELSGEIIDTTISNNPPPVDPPTGGTGGDLMVKMQEFGDHTEQTIQLTWDNNKRLATYVMDGQVGGLDTAIRYRFFRTADGKVSRVLESGFPGRNNIDSVVHNVYYDANGRLHHLRGAIYRSGQIRYLDSTLYTYNGSGKITQKEVYNNSNSNLAIMSKSNREKYTYDEAGNMLSQEIAVVVRGTYTVTTTNSFVYGTHKAPVQLGPEAFMVWLAPLTSANHTTKSTQKSGSATIVVDFTQGISYNAKDRPTTGQLLYTGGGLDGSSDYVYSYQ